MTGLPIAAVLTVIFVWSGLSNGWWSTYEVLLSIESPKDATSPALALVVSLIGWALMPAVIGAVTGLLVQRQIEGYRNEREADVVERLTRQARSGDGN